MAALTAQQVRDYIADSDDNNHLIDGVEFSDSRVGLAMEMALDSYNMIPPITSENMTTFGSKAVLLYGTLWHLYNGQVAIAARNQMSYSDGGLTIPIEERYQFYIQLAEMYSGQFKAAAKDLKVARNMEAAWGSIPTDYSTFPIW